MRGNNKIAEVFDVPRRRARLAMRLTVAEKDSISAAAQAVHQTLTGYLLTLHKHYTRGRKRTDGGETPGDYHRNRDKIWEVILIFVTAIIGAVVKVLVN